MGRPLIFASLSGVETYPFSVVPQLRWRLRGSGFFLTFRITTSALAWPFGDCLIFFIFILFLFSISVFYEPFNYVTLVRACLFKVSLLFRFLFASLSLLRINVKCLIISGFLCRSTLGSMAQSQEPSKTWSLIGVFSRSSLVSLERQKPYFNAFFLISAVVVGEAIKNINFLQIWISIIISAALTCCTINNWFPFWVFTFNAWFRLTSTPKRGWPIFLSWWHQYIANHNV